MLDLKTLDVDVRPWRAGDHVGAYTLARQVAAGGMAEVWEARFDGPGGFSKRVAVKRLMPALTEDPHFVALFVDEARLLAGLHHPHICQVLELGERDGSYWVAMEYLAGHTAYELMRETVMRGLRLPLELAVLIARDTAEALTYAHGKRDDADRPLGIIHRDVSPQNVMVTYEGVVKLVDFGIAKAATRTVVTETGQLRGKLAYMPPEQARAEPLDARADQFSLGAMLFELVTHTRLHTNRKEIELFRELAGGTEPFARPQSRAPEVPDELDAIIRRMLERDREARYRSMNEVRDALDAFLGARPRPLSSAEALARFMTGCFPPEARPAFTPSSELPVIVGTLAAEKSIGRMVRRRAPLAIVAIVAVLAAGALGWFATRPSEAQPSPAAPNVALPPPQPPPAPLAVVPVTPEPQAEADELEPVADLKRQAGQRSPRLKPGFLSLQTTPWTVVYLGRRQLGETPLAGVTLPAGTHRLRLVNEEKKLSTTIEVEINAGKTTTKRLKF